MPIFSRAIHKAAKAGQTIIHTYDMLAPCADEGVSASVVILKTTTHPRPRPRLDTESKSGTGTGTGS